MFFTKKILSLLILLAGITLSAAEGTFNELPVKVVLFPIREATLSTPIDGIISKYNFRGGERFRKNDVLLTLDDRKFKNELRRTESLVKEAEMNVAFTKQRLEDNERLLKNDLQSEIEVLRSRFDWNVAIERLETARINRDGAALNLLFCTLRAPFSGTIEKLLIREFEMVRAGQPVLAIIDDTELLAVMNLPSSKLSAVKNGLPVTVKITENNRTVRGTIYEIASRADHRSETFEIKVKINNSKRLFKAGMSGVLIKLGE